MKVMLAGGGTGGHVYPAIAMGDALRGRGHEVVYAGAPDRLEGRVAPERGYDFLPVEAPQYPRSGLHRKLAFAAALGASVGRARATLAASRPDLVLGVGGYIMAPTVLAAWSMGIPRAIHESNVSPGLANKLCARVADLVLMTYDKTRDRLPGDAPKETVGCPVNPRILQGDRAAAHARYGLDPARPTLLVVGGSLGAATLNALALAAARMTERPWQLIWVSGPTYHEQAARDLGEVPPGVALVGYEDRMGDAYAAADMAVCRAGSSTLAELTAVGLPSLLIPSPNVTENHQEANARGLEQVAAALVMTEAELDVAAALDRITALLTDPAALARMSEAARAQGRLDVAEQVADRLEALLAG